MPEPFYPLHAYVCERCFLVQLPRLERAGGDLQRLRLLLLLLGLAGSRTRALRRADDRALRPRAEQPGGRDRQQRRLPAAATSRARGVPVLGIEPAANVAAAAEASGHPDAARVLRRRDWRASSRPSGVAADLLRRQQRARPRARPQRLRARASTPCSRRAASLTIEFPHLLRLIDEDQFDTIYHEHFSYFSLATARRVFAAHGLDLFDVEELPTHGGSLRVYAARAPGDAGSRCAERVERAARARERGRPRDAWPTYRAFAERVARGQARAARLPDRGAGATGEPSPATARRPRATRCSTTAASRADLLDYTVDRSPHKQGRFLPGTRIPIRAPETHLARRGPTTC